MLEAAEGSRERSGSSAAHFYYLGRLSVRDSNVNWTARILADVEADPVGLGTNGEMLGTCLGVVSGQLPR